MPVVSRFEAELIVQMLVGGQAPEEGGALVYTRHGWRLISFSRLLKGLSEAQTLDDVAVVATELLNELEG
jgi:hypothetical protein